MYYYTSNGTYRKTRITIDFLMTIMTVVIVALFTAILFWQSMRGILFPIIFVSGAIVNMLNAIKNFINSNKKAGILLTCVAIALIILTAFCWNIELRV